MAHQQQHASTGNDQARPDVTQEEKAAAQPPTDKLREQHEPEKNNDRDAGKDHRNGNHHQ